MSTGKSSAASLPEEKLCRAEMGENGRKSTNLKAPRAREARISKKAIALNSPIDTFCAPVAVLWGGVTLTF
jgi:hypothetical protein